MKFISCILLAATFFLTPSCKSKTLSDSDKQLLETKIFIHCSQAKVKYNTGKINAETEAEIKYLGWSKKDSLVLLAGKSFGNSWNNPYDIRQDTGLTVARYLKYCEERGLDSKTYINELVNLPPSN